MGTPSSLRRYMALGAALLALAQSPASAVTIASGSNTTDPGTFPWNNVGQVNGVSGIYLGDIAGNGTYWVLTAFHVAGSLPATVNFNGTGSAALETYNTVAGSYVQLNNTPILLAHPTATALADMAMFRVDRLDTNGIAANLPTLAISTSIPTSTATLSMVGYGGGTKQWGTNVADVTSGTPASRSFLADAGPGDNLSYGTYDNGIAAGPNEAQVISGDSGGAVFQFTGGLWQLTGMLFAAATDGVPPPGTNDFSIAADLSAYRSEIIGVAAAAPEPGMTALVAAGLCALGGTCLRRARRKL